MKELQLHEMSSLVSNGKYQCYTYYYLYIRNFQTQRSSITKWLNLCMRVRNLKVIINNKIKFKYWNKSFLIHTKFISSIFLQLSKYLCPIKIVIYYFRSFLWRNDFCMFELFLFYSLYDLFCVPIMIILF